MVLPRKTSDFLAVWHVKYLHIVDFRFSHIFFYSRGNQTGPDGTVSHSNKSQVTPFKTMDPLDLCEQVGGLVEEKCQIVGNYFRVDRWPTPHRRVILWQHNLCNCLLTEAYEIEQMFTTNLFTPRHVSRIKLHEYIINAAIRWIKIKYKSLCLTRRTTVRPLGFQRTALEISVFNEER